MVIISLLSGKEIKFIRFLELFQNDCWLVWNYLLSYTLNHFQQIYVTLSTNDNS